MLQGISPKAAERPSTPQGESTHTGVDLALELLTRPHSQAGAKTPGGLTQLPTTVLPTNLRSRSKKRKRKKRERKGLER